MKKVVRRLHCHGESSIYNSLWGSWNQCAAESVKNPSPGVSRGTYEFQRNLIQNLMLSNRTAPNFRLHGKARAR